MSWISYPEQVFRYRLVQKKPVRSHANRTLSGPVFGGGIEYAVSPAVSLKAEHMRLDIGERTLMDVIGYPGGYQQAIDVGPIDTIKIGINFHLNTLAH